MEWNTFISYRRRTGYLMAEYLHTKLEAMGVSSYMDVHEYEKGRFDQRIYEVIKNCPNFILVLSKNCFNRCIDEEDWVRKEISYALAHNKNIVPVLMNDYKAPRKEFLEKLPAEFSTLSYRSGVTESPEYGNAMIETLVRLLGGVEGRLGHKDHSGDNTLDFYQKYLQDSNVCSIAMAFHAGDIWFTDDHHLEVMRTIIDKKIQTRVLINTPSAAEILASHMRAPLKRYTSFEQCITEWKKIEEKFPDLFDIRMVNLPLLRITHSIYFEDSTKNRILLKHYTYNNPSVGKNAKSEYVKGDPQYSVYEDEFQYLWNLSEPI